MHFAVTHIHAPFVCRNRDRVVQVAAKAEQERADRREHGHSIQRAVHNEQVSRCFDRDLVGGSELPFVSAFRSERALQRARFQVEHVYAAFAALCDEQFAFAPHHTAHAVEAALGQFDLADEFAVANALNESELVVANEDVALVHAKSANGDKLPICIAHPAEGAQNTERRRNRDDLLISVRRENIASRVERQAPAAGDGVNAGQLFAVQIHHAQAQRIANEQLIGRRAREHEQRAISGNLKLPQKARFLRVLRSDADHIA